MKYIKSILIIAVVIIALVFVAKHFGKTETEPGTVSTVPSADHQELCFLWNTEAGDKATIVMDISGSEVTGNFNWLPAEKDKKTGPFKGTISAVDPVLMGRTIDALWETSAEGMTVTEELKIIMGEGNAAAGFGEMKDRGDGVYVYADPEHLSYVPNLTDTDCSDSALQ